MARAKVEKVNVVPDAATSRLDLTCLQGRVDAMMAQVPKNPLDMADPRQRDGLKKWLTGHLEDFLHQIVWDFKKGSERGIDQIALLINDPTYYQTQKQRRAQAAIHQKEVMDRSNAEWRARNEAREAELLAEQEARDAEVRDLIQAGKIIPGPGMKWAVEEVKPTPTK